jgi:hypothetical protein
MNAYLRATKKFPRVRAQALERLSQRPDRPVKPDKPTGKVRAREADGTYKGDDPTTPVVNEAWVPAP